MENLVLIKVCVDPGCEAVFHNCLDKETHCGDCGGRIIRIDEATFWAKFSNNWFQYDCNTGEYYRPVKKVVQMVFDFGY